MRVVMATNTYLPHVGGVANAVDRMTRSLRKLGHEVLVIGPGDDPTAAVRVDGTGVVRVPAIKGIGGTDFSLPMAATPQVIEIIARFDPAVVHSHHPFLLGEAALKAARAIGRPCLFTHHTMYERIAVNMRAPRPLRTFGMARLAAATASYTLAASVPVLYANRCDALMAPTDSVARMSHERGVTVPIYVTPSGIDAEVFMRPNRVALRKKYAISPSSFVVGHVGRLSKEKGLDFLAEAIGRFLAKTSTARAVIVGGGPCADEMRWTFSRFGVGARVRWTGVLRGQALADAFGAMDVFAFSSESETQGLVLAEAMAAGAPVIALDGTGTRDIVDGQNGEIVRHGDPGVFADRLAAWARRTPEELAASRAAAQATGASYALEKTTEKLVAVYRRVALAATVRHG